MAWTTGETPLHHPLILYLRPFKVDSTEVNLYTDDSDTLFISDRVRLDEELALALDSVGTMVCIGKPTKFFHVGVPNVRSTNENWMDDAVKLMRLSRVIVVAPTMSGMGVAIEVGLLLGSSEFLKKTIFFFPPLYTHAANSLITWKIKKSLSRFVNIEHVDLDRGAIFIVTGEWTPIAGNITSRSGLTAALEHYVRRIEAVA